MNIVLSIDGVAYTVTPTPASPTGPTGPTAPTGPTGTTGGTGGTGPTAVGSSAGAPAVPTTAKKVNMLTPPGAWEFNHDAGTSGTASNLATTYPVTSPDKRPNCRQFNFTLAKAGGAIFHTAVLPSGAGAFNRFVYKKREMYLKAIPTNCETDLEITDTATGVPYDMAMQQDGYKKVEDITINHKWTGVNIAVDPSTRKTNTWYESAEYVGFNPATKEVTYFGVEIDGTYYPINQTVVDADNAVWSKGMLNFQMQYDTSAQASTDFVILTDVLEVDCYTA
jgi:hypothetical protein